MTLVGVWKLVERNRTWTVQVSFSCGTAQTAPCGCSGNGKGPWMPRLGTCVLGSHGFFCAMLYKGSQQAISGSREEKRDSTPLCKVKVWWTGEGNSTLVFSLPQLPPSCRPASRLVAVLQVLVSVYCYHEILRTL